MTKSRKILAPRVKRCHANARANMTDITFTREEIKKHESFVENIRNEVFELKRINHVVESNLKSANGKISVLVDLLRNVLVPLSTMAYGENESEDLQDLDLLTNRIKAAIHSAIESGAS